MELKLSNIRDLDGFVRDEGEPLDCTITVEVEFDQLLEEKQLYISDWRVVDFSHQKVDDYIDKPSFVLLLGDVIQRLAFDKRLQEIAEAKTEEQIERTEASIKHWEDIHREFLKGRTALE